jgi:glycogen operon protein
VLQRIEPGPARDEARRQLQRNLLATLLLSMGTPMIGAGDEWGRSQQGHDNAYDQDNAISWLDWGRADQELRRFVQHLIRLRSSIPWLQHADWPGRGLSITWLRPDGQPLGDEDWQAPRTHLALVGSLDGLDALLLLNAGDDPVAYDLPNDSPATWHVAVQTTVTDVDEEPAPASLPFAAPPRSVSLLLRRVPEAVS